MHNLVISNVPGPQIPLYFLGSEVKAMYPLGPIFHGSGLNITVMSLNGKLDVGIVSCPELLPDLWDLADDFEMALDEWCRARANPPEWRSARTDASPWQHVPHEPETRGSLRPHWLCCWWRVAARWSTGAPSPRCHRRGHRSDGPPARPPIRWPIPPDAECGKLSVPVDYSKPDGDVAQLAMIRFKATGDKIGSLVINPGGPGESGVESAANLVARCRSPCANASTWWASIRAASGLYAGGVVQLRRRQRPVAGRSPGRLFAGRHPTHRQRDQGVRTACLDKTGKEFLANVGTANVVKDLDAIRAALGDDKLTFLGYSYGTRIGGSYAEEFPQNVRAMVLDGAIDPNADPIEEDLRQTAAFQKAFDDYSADCAKDPTCPLGTDPAKAAMCTRGWSSRWWTSPPRQRTRVASPTATRSSAQFSRCIRRASGLVSPTASTSSESGAATCC